MKHLKTFEGYSNVELTNEEEIWGMFKSGDSKGFAIATQGNNFEQYVQQALNPRSRSGKTLKREFQGEDISDLSKDDFMRYAKLIKKLEFDYKAIKGAVKADSKLERIHDYICARGYASASHTAPGTRQFGSGEGATDRYGINPSFDPIAAVERCKERVEAKQVAEPVKKEMPPRGKFESVRNRK